MNRDVNVLVLTGYGLNCDHETAHAFERAGARARRVHINALIDGTERLDGFQIMVFIGGFSWGDDHGAGVIQAVRLKNAIGDRILDFIAAGHLVLGICNGFQTLVNLGLLPGIDGDYTARTVALTHNDCGNFRDDWVHLRINPASPCVFTRGMARLYLPVRHGEGKFFTDAPVLDRLIQNQQVVMQYAGPDGEPAGGRFPDNPNGAMADIAGICDPTGRVFGLMPHPEAYNDPTNHPGWTRDRAMIAQYRQAPAPGVQLLKNAVDFVRGR
jgi:phosphoribosylformylglycinamidine synthase